jgi:hypothetical protein
MAYGCVFKSGLVLCKGFCMCECGTAVASFLLVPIVRATERFARSY